MGNCVSNGDCGVNAICVSDPGSPESNCKCVPGYYDNPPKFTAESNGCPGKH
uniref:EGF-like domain-containing protein n=1 Tax=Magallana gigas TaxID=29159 RepID=K1Q2K2_MAGGI